MACPHGARVPCRGVALIERPVSAPSGPGLNRVPAPQKIFSAPLRVANRNELIFEKPRRVAESAMRHLLPFDAGVQWEWCAPRRSLGSPSDFGLVGVRRVSVENGHPHSTSETAPPMPWTRARAGARNEQWCASGRARESSIAMTTHQLTEQDADSLRRGVG
jgi:hypothetical protein